MTRAEIAAVLHTHRWKSWSDDGSRPVFVCKAGCRVWTDTEPTSRAEAEHQADVLAGLLDKEKDRLL